MVHQSGRNAVHITRNDEKGIWSLVPATSNEAETLSSVANFLPVGTKMSYMGRETDPDDGNALALSFNAGGKGSRVTKGSATSIDYVGGVSFTLVGTTPEDKEELKGMRDTCYMASSGLILIEILRASRAQPGLLFTAEFCKHCNAPMIKMGRCEWKTCDACVDKCDHDWKTGAIHGGGIDIGVGEACRYCGIRKPKSDNEPEKSPLAHALAYQEFDPDTILIYNGVPVRELAARMQKAGVTVEMLEG